MACLPKKFVAEALWSDDGMALAKLLKEGILDTSCQTILPQAY